MHCFNAYGLPEMLKWNMISCKDSSSWCEWCIFLKLVNSNALSFVGMTHKLNTRWSDKGCSRDLQCAVFAMQHAVCTGVDSISCHVEEHSDGGCLLVIIWRREEMDGRGRRNREEMDEELVRWGARQRPCHCCDHLTLASSWMNKWWEGGPQWIWNYIYVRLCDCNLCLCDCVNVSDVYELVGVCSNCHVPPQSPTTVK